MGAPGPSQGQLGPRWLLEADRGDEIVASSWNGDDVAMIALAIAERAAQGADLDLKIRFFDKGFWPGSGHQFRLPDNLAGHTGGVVVKRQSVQL